MSSRKHIMQALRRADKKLPQPNSSVTSWGIRGTHLHVPNDGSTEKNNGGRPKPP